MATEPSQDFHRGPRPAGLAGDIPSVYPVEDRFRGAGFADPRAHGLARALGWFSIGLGIAELAAPRSVARLIGVAPRDGLLRALGAREVVSGCGILSRRAPAAWVGSRVAGDLMDLALLATALSLPRTSRGRTLAATAAVLGVTALDAIATRELSRGRALARGQRLAVERSITINASAETCYQFWRDLRNLPRFMRDVEEVRPLDERRSHWVVQVPGAGRLEWDSELTDDRPGELLAWRTCEGADFPSSGVVRFERAPQGTGTVVRLAMQYEPPGGRRGATAAKLIGKEPGQQVRADLRRFKQLLETGELPTTRGQPAGRRSLFVRALRGRRAQ